MLWHGVWGIMAIHYSLSVKKAEHSNRTCFPWIHSLMYTSTVLVLFFSVSQPFIYLFIHSELSANDHACAVAMVTRSWKTTHDLWLHLWTHSIWSSQKYLSADVSVNLLYCIYMNHCLVCTGSHCRLCINSKSDLCLRLNIKYWTEVKWTEFELLIHLMMSLLTLAAEMQHRSNSSNCWGYCIRSILYELIICCSPARLPTNSKSFLWKFYDIYSPHCSKGNMAWAWVSLYFSVTYRFIHFYLTQTANSQNPPRTLMCKSA